MIVRGRIAPSTPAGSSSVFVHRPQEGKRKILAADRPPSRPGPHSPRARPLEPAVRPTAAGRGRSAPAILSRETSGPARRAPLAGRRRCSTRAISSRHSSRSRASPPIPPFRSRKRVFRRVGTWSELAPREAADALSPPQSVVQAIRLVGFASTRGEGVATETGSRPLTQRSPSPPDTALGRSGERFHVEILYGRLPQSRSRDREYGTLAMRVIYKC